MSSGATNKTIKYLFKYINKTPDRIMTIFFENGYGQTYQKSKDEIRNFITCYLSPLRLLGGL